MASTPSTEGESETMKRHIIRSIRLAHCKRGPDRCEECRTTTGEAICLLDICPPDPGCVQRRVIEVEVDGQSTWREYDVIRSFASEAEARDYAAREGIKDVEI